MATDIVITSCNRYDYLKETLWHLLNRTTTAHRLFAIDDGSSDCRIRALLASTSGIHQTSFKPERTGQRANMYLARRLTCSDPVVFVDDDVLCPSVTPGWLAQGLTAMRLLPSLGMLALNHPGAKRKKTGQHGAVTYCKSLGGTYLFVRRAVLSQLPYPDRPGDLGRALEPLCVSARKEGWQLGYLTNVFCYHLGQISVQDDRPYGGKFIPPQNWETLEPPTRYRG